VALAAVWLAAGYYFVLGGEYTLFDVRSLRAERDSLSQRVDSLRVRADSLEARAERLRDDPFAVERTARERYGFIRDGERLYRFLEPVPDGGGTGVDRSGNRR
jgi:cell division protein FtsB